MSARVRELAARAAGSVRWSLLFGNFVAGCGVMSVAGTLNDLSRSLQVSVALGGQLITIAGVALAFGAPLLAGIVAGWDRRRLLTLSLLWYAVGHALSAMADSYALLWPVRTLTILAAAVFTPQAAAALSTITPPGQRAGALTFVLLGWSLASVLGMPISAWLGETFGWQTAFGAIALLSLLAAAWVHAALPDGIRPPAMSLASWRRIFTHPVLMAIVAATALYSAGQFTLLSYLAPYYRQALDADATQTSLLFGWFGVCGMIGNVLLSRYIDRIGAGRSATALMALVAVGLLLWPLAHTMVAMTAVLVPWALGAFAANSAQQARLGMSVPGLAPALMALNSSSIYLGQAAGAASGGWLVVTGGFAPLSWVALAWMLGAIALSAWAGRRAVGAISFAG